MISRPKLTEIGALIGVSAAISWMTQSIPSRRDVIADPCIVATLATAAFVAFLWVSEVWGHRTIKAELLLLAAFLCSMPIVYVMRYLVAANATTNSWLWLELAGIPIFATLAVLGVKKSPWFLVIGIVAHGLSWDSWHYRNSGYVPNWYSLGCLLVDITIGAYVAARILNIEHALTL